MKTTPKAGPTPAIPQVFHSRHEVPSAQHQRQGLFVTNVGYVVRHSRTNVKDRALGSYCGVWITEGQAWFESAPTGKRVLPAGTFYWLFPTVEHSYGPLDGPWTCRWAIFGGAMAEEFERQGVLSPVNPFVAVGDEPEMAALFEKLDRTFVNSGPLSVPMAAAYVHQMIILVHGIASGLMGQGAERSNSLAPRAVRIIESTHGAELDPEAIAARLHTGYSTLRRQFRAQTGYSLKEYILRVRLKRAKNLLALSPMTIEEIAAETGFVDPYYFSRLFRKREGVAPSVFRKNPVFAEEQ